MAVTTATAVFNATQDSVAVTWTGITSNPPTATSGVCTSDGSVVEASISALTNTGCTVSPSSRFTGTVEIVVSD